MPRKPQVPVRGPVNCKICRRSMYLGDPGYDDHQHATLVGCVEALAFAIELIENDGID